MHFTYARPTDTTSHERFFGSPICFGSAFNGFVCGRASLDLPLPLANPEMARNTALLLRNQRLPDFKAPVVEIAKQAISTLLTSGRADPEGVAAKLGTTP